MSGGESVSRWIRGLRAGAADSAARIWRRYRPRILRLARAVLRGAPQAVADEDDVASQAFHSFCRRVQHGDFPELDRDGLWPLLGVIIRRKAHNQRRAAQRPWAAASGSQWGRALLIEDDPAAIAVAREELQHLLRKLQDDALAQIAVLKLEGRTNVEIAAEIGRSVPTVERRLRLIRSLWTAAAGGEHPEPSKHPEHPESSEPEHPESSESSGASRAVRQSGRGAAFQDTRPRSARPISSPEAPPGWGVES